MMQKKEILHGKEKFDQDRSRFLAEAESKPELWVRHTQYHWSMTIGGDRLDYWPSRKKFMYKGVVTRGLRALYKIIGSTNKGRS